jgi:hypothetical protein
MHVITWNRSFKNLPDHDDLNDNFEIDDRFETHAAVLDRMLAWEKKLYDEVKVIYIYSINLLPEFWYLFVLHVNAVCWST